MERVTLPVSVSLMKRTSREFWRTTILYSHVSVQGFTISTCSFSIANFPILGKNLKYYSEIRIIVLEIKPRTNKYHKDKMPPFQKFVFYLLQKSIYQNPNSKIKLKKKNVKLKNQIQGITPPHPTHAPPVSKIKTIVPKVKNSITNQRKTQTQNQKNNKKKSRNQNNYFINKTKKIN